MFLIFNILNTWWSKSLCAPDDYSTIIRCTETFWSPCRSFVQFFSSQCRIFVSNFTCL